MLENDSIQPRGFRNLTEGDQVIGIQVAFRSLNIAASGSRHSGQQP